MTPVSGQERYIPIAFAAVAPSSLTISTEPAFSDLIAPPRFMSGLIDPGLEARAMSAVASTMSANDATDGSHANRESGDKRRRLLTLIRFGVITLSESTLSKNTYPSTGHTRYDHQVSVRSRQYMGAAYVFAREKKSKSILRCIGFGQLNVGSSNEDYARRFIDDEQNLFRLGFRQF